MDKLDDACDEILSNENNLLLQRIYDEQHKTLIQDVENAIREQTKLCIGQKSSAQAKKEVIKQYTNCTKFFKQNIRMCIIRHLQQFEASVTVISKFKFILGE
jgi:RNase P/RNase MRP subunit POP5